MIDIEKHVITDESGSPVAVQIRYEDWLRLEGYLAALSSESRSSDPAPGAESETNPGAESETKTPPADRPAHGPADPTAPEPSAPPTAPSAAPSADSSAKAGFDPSPSASEEDSFQQRLLEEWESLDATSSDDPRPSAPDLEEALESARGSWSRPKDGETYLRELRAQWDRLSS
jgi:hypothetical protein